MLLSTLSYKMHPSLVLISLVEAFALAQTPAPPSKYNPQGVQYSATFGDTGPLSTRQISLAGSMVVEARPDGNGIDVQVSISGLPMGELLGEKLAQPFA